MQKHISDEPTEHLSLVGKTMIVNKELMEKQQDMLTDHKVKCQQNNFILNSHIESD